MPLSSELTLASSPRAAADARRWVSDICRRLDRPDLVECAELGVSELVANAILHGEAPYKVRVRGTASHPRIEVVDGSTRPPVPPAPLDLDDLDLLLTFGRGLAIVSQCALAWGATIESDSKIVWFEPSEQMSDEGSAEWVIDQHDADAPEPTSEAAVEVRLIGIDVPLHSSLEPAVPRAAPRAAPAVAVAPVRLPPRRRPHLDVRQLRAPVPRRLPPPDPRRRVARRCRGSTWPSRWCARPARSS